MNEEKQVGADLAGKKKQAAESSRNEGVFEVYGKGWK